jgi:uncharacterized protein YidB (DUF937 family)
MQREYVMGLLDELLGNQAEQPNQATQAGAAAGGVSLLAVAGELLNRVGGVGGLVNLLKEHGMGSAAQSWVGTGENQQVSPDQLGQALQGGGLGSMLQEAAGKLGTSPDDLLGKLSGVLPQTVDHLTPEGQVPQQASGGFDLGSLGPLAGKLFS